jgi:hypothetical protein
VECDNRRAVCALMPRSCCISNYVERGEAAQVWARPVGAILAFVINYQERGGGQPVVPMGSVHRHLTIYVDCFFGFFLLYTDRVPFELLDSAALL